jgi:uncharacterized protein YbjT (DUF2867 family)
MGEKTIVVVGATGAQGGGLARAILADRTGEFAVRALTRDASSAKARALAASGAEVVEANADDAASLARAFAGAYGAYCVTFFWDHFSPERENAQAKAMAQAAAQAGLRHVIWSTLEDTRRFVPLGDDRMPTLMGKYKVPHFDAKGEANRYFQEAGVPTTFLLTAFYWDNFIHLGMGPREGDDGVLRLTLPMGEARLPGIATEDIGRCAYGVFREGASTVGRTIGVAGGHPTGAEMAAAFTRALDREVRYQAIAPDVYRGLGFPGAEDLGNMFQFKRDFSEAYCAARNIEGARALNPELQSFAVWLERNRERIPIG